MTHLGICVFNLRPRTMSVPGRTPGFDILFEVRQTVTLCSEEYSQILSGLFMQQHAAARNVV